MTTLIMSTLLVVLLTISVHNETHVTRSDFLNYLELCIIHWPLFSAEVRKNQETILLNECLVCVFVTYRYAFRDNMTDVIIQHLITEQKGMFIDIGMFVTF